MSVYLWDTYWIRNLLFLFNVSNYVRCQMHLTLDYTFIDHATGESWNACTQLSIGFYCFACNFDCMSFRWNSKWNTVQFNYILKIAALFYTIRKHIHSTKIAFFSLSFPFFYRIIIGGVCRETIGFWWDCIPASSGNLKNISIALHPALWFSLLWQCMSVYAYAHVLHDGNQSNSPHF